MKIEQVDEGYQVLAKGTQMVTGENQEIRFTAGKTPATAMSKARRDIGRLETAINRMKL